MATKQVQETLGQFEDWKFFSVLESKNESDEDAKLAAEDEKDGLDVIKKLQDNLERFKSASGDKILKFKEFWEENQKATDGFDEEGDLYKLWDSDYVVGVLNLPDEALSDEELDAEIAEVDGDAVELEDDEKEESEESEEGEEDEEKDEEEAEEDEEDEEEEAEEDEEEEELEEGNAFSGALEKAKKEGKKEFKVDGKTYPVKESLIPEGEDFPLYEQDEDEEGELPAEDVVTPDETSPEEKEEIEDQEGGFKGFEAPGGEEEEVPEEGDEFSADDEVEVEDGEAVELDGDLDGDGTEEGGMEFAGEPGTSEYLVVYDINGDREEVFRCSSPKAIEAFRDFFENQFKASIKEQIQKFKQAQEEKKAEEERKAKEAIRAEKKSKLDKFMKA